jgi:SAM-dependent methyltransferase
MSRPTTIGWNRSGAERWALMDADAFRFLLSSAGQAALAELAGEPLTPDTHLALAARLRASLPPNATAAVLETALLRQRAARKFSRAAVMYFTRDGLEQATAEPVAAHRARRFATAGATTVADLGCGIGGDALALAATGAHVVAVDREWLHATMTGANAAVYGVAHRLLPVQADLLELAPLPADAFFFDPARRAGGGPRDAPARRLRSVDEYRPPLSLIDAWRPLVPHGAVKVSPGIDYAELPPDAEVEFVSFEGEVREGVLWFGGLRGAAQRRATILPAGETLSDADGPGEAPVGPPRAYLYEPDGAIIRAHLVTQLAGRLGAALLDPTIAYLTADLAQVTPFARCFQIEEAFPFQLKHLRQELRRRGVGRVTIKKRGSPLDPDDLRQALKLRGDAHMILFLTQVMGRPTVVLAQPLPDASD